LNPFPDNLTKPNLNGAFLLAHTPSNIGNKILSSMFIIKNLYIKVRI